MSHPKEEELKSPEECDTTPYLCEHHKLTYNFDDYIDNINNMAIMLVVSDEWELIKNRYAIDLFTKKIYFDLYIIF